MTEERTITMHDRLTFWLGKDADYDQCVIDAVSVPEPLIVVDTSDCDE